MQEEHSIIVVRDLSKAFEGRIVLDRISIDVRKGEVFVIMGGSGCGKTTLLRNLIGSIKPDSGNVYLYGKDINTLNYDELDKLKLKFGMVFQSSALFDSMNVEQNVGLPLVEHTKLDSDSIKSIVGKKLELVGMRGANNLMPSQLSGGMKKRVGIARAIAMDPEIVFYDEPTVGLDPIVAGVIDRLIIDLSNKLMITSIVVTHNMNSVFKIADRIGMLYKGKIIQIGTPDEIKNSENEIVRQFIQGKAEGPIKFLQFSEEYF